MREIKKRLKELEKAIAPYVGIHRIDSPKDLQKFIFETLAISTEGVQKTKNGFSVSLKELKKIKDRHEFIPLLVEYQELSSDLVKLSQKKTEEKEIAHEVFDIPISKEEETSLPEIIEEVHISEEIPALVETVSVGAHIPASEPAKELEKKITLEELHLVIEGEYKRMAFLLTLVALVVGFFWYAQYNYSANFVDSMAAVGNTVNN